MSDETKPRRDGLAAAVVVLTTLVIVVHPTSYAFSLAWLARWLGFPEKIVSKAPRLAPADILIWAAGALLLLRMLIKRDFRALKMLPVPAVVLVLLAILSALFAQNRLTAVADVIQYAEYFLVLYVLLQVFLDRESVLRGLPLGWLMIVAGVACFAYDHYAEAGRDAVHVSATFLNRNILSGYLAMLLPLAWGLLVFKRTDLRHPIPRVAWYLALVMVLGLGFVCMLAGGPWIAAAVGILIVSMIRSKKLFPLVLVALLLLVIGVYPLLPRNNTEVLVKSLRVYDEELKTGVRVERTGLVESARLNPRYVEWQAGLKFLTPGQHRELGIPRTTHIRQLLLGVGIGNYQQNIGRFYGYLPKPAENTTEPDTQSLYLVTAVSVGIPAFLAFLWVLGAFLRRAALGYARAQDPFLRGLLLGCIGSLSGLLITNVFTSTLVHGTGPAMILVFAFASSGARLAERGSGAAE